MSDQATLPNLNAEWVNYKGTNTSPVFLEDSA
jgi:hypothetical protein